MGQVINTNSLSLLTQNNLNKSQGALNTSIQRLSSGLRINSAKDDAAGQAIANRFSANIKGLTQASRNANDGISLAQTTEGALNEVNTNLQRIRELTVQSANGSNSAADKVSIQAEITQRLDEIDRTSKQTDFNGVKVLSSAAATLNVQVGANDGETISIGLKEISSKTLGLTGFNVDGSGTPNAAATESSVKLQAAYTKGTAGTAGYTTGAAYAKGSTDAQGTTTYTSAKVVFAATNVAATKANVFSAVVDGDTVKVGGAAATGINSYVVSGAGVAGATAAAAVFTSNTTSTQASTVVDAALTPAAGGGQTLATVTIGGKTQDISIASNGDLTDKAGKTLYVDSVGNLSTTNSQAAPAGSKIADLTASMDITGAGSISTVTAGGSTKTFSTLGAAATTWKTTNALSQTDMQAAAAGVTTDVSLAGATTNVSSTSVVKAGAGGTGAATFYDPSKVGTAKLTAISVDTIGVSTTDSLYVHSNGAVMDGAGNQVYSDSDKTNKTGITLNAKSGVTATEDPLKALDAALSQVDKLRGSLGAVQNRFDSVISNLGSTITNLSSSRSRIEDADYATEVSNMTRAQILQQAGTSVLAKANQSTQGVMSLLQ